MRELHYRIQNELGVHARPAAHLAKLASGFGCDIGISSERSAVNAKGIIGIMGLALKQGDELHMTFDGEDEDLAADEMLGFLERNL